MFANKVVLITGASSGIGAETALDFSKLDAKLVITGRNKGNLEKVAKQCQENSPNDLKPLIVIADMNIESDVENIMKRTIDEFKQLDVLVNNAGILESGSIENTTLAQYDRVMNTNVRGPYHLTMLATPHLVKTQGNIVNVSSVTGLRSFPNVLAYCMSKSALDQFTRCVALELAPKNVRVNAVNPGVITTGIHMKSSMNEQEYEVFIKKCADSHALGRAGDAKEVSSVILFLVSRMFTNKVVLVTGASSGIGAETAIEFAKQDARLVLSGRNKENLEKTAKVCEAASPSKLAPLSVIADMDKEADVERLVKETINHFKQLDVLVNNAGIMQIGSIEDTSLAQFDSIMNTNVRAPYHLTMLATPHLVESKGNIVNVSSVGGLRSFPGILAYCMSKATLDQFTRCVSLELASKGVRVNAVNPGVIETNIHLRAGFKKEDYAAYLEKSKGTHALGRTGTTKEVANTILFLASEGASNITGTTIAVDGGKHAMCPR